MDEEPVRIPITDVFDLHSVPPREVKAVIEAYLEEAHSAGFRYIRIIHGRGIGVQREIVGGCSRQPPLLSRSRMLPLRQAGGVLR